jgi:hypothetical protein
MAMSLPIEFIDKENTNTIKYPIHVACECDYEIYVDGKFVDQANKEVNVIEYVFEGHPGWNATKFFNPVITTKSPNIIAFHGTGGEFSGFINGFVMDMNNGEDYTKYQEWKCKEFKVSAVPLNWYSYDYDDSLWEMAKSFGMNYQNNSFQIFERERANIHLNAEWLWTQDNSKTNVFCRKKDRHVQTIPLRTTTLFHPTTASLITTPAPTTPAPTTYAPTHANVLKTTHYIPLPTAAQTTHANVLKTTHRIPLPTAAPTTHANVLKTTHYIPLPTAAPTTHTNVLKTTHYIPATTAAPTTHANVLKTTHYIPATTAAPTTHANVSKTTHYIPATTAAPTTHANVLKTTHRIPMPTAAPTTHANVLKTTHRIPMPTAAPTTHANVLKTIHHLTTTTPATTHAPLIKPETQNIYNIKNNIKIIINNAKVSKNIIDKHMSTIFRYLQSVKNDRDDRYDNDYKLRDELYYIVKQAHTHIHHHYDNIVDYYKKLLRDTYDDHEYDHDQSDEGSDEYERDEKGEKGENKNRLNNSSKIIESMIKLNHYIKVIEYKIHFIKGETKYNLLQILYSLRKQYQDDMIQMLKYL